MISIDNYDEINQRLSGEIKSQVIAKIEQCIYEWALKYSALVVKVERDKFYVVIDNKNLENAKKDKMNILQQIKELQILDGIQSTFDLLDGTQFINMDISQLEERFARPLAQQILLSWIWEKYVKKNSEDKSKAGKKRVLVDEAWMLLPFPEAVDFLNKMARRARKRNVSLAVVSQRFQDFYEKSEVQAVLTSSDTKLFLSQDKSEIQYIQEVFKLSEGEASFLTTCARGEGLFKVGEQTAIIEIRPTKKELEFIETNVNNMMQNKTK